ncbi:CAA Xprenyl protease [Schizosaccharomyces cryophilus OY26]|uniref:intramembrane prenyl-peptidase Rce1 n=1 Tax=Schizosaccharomyces cryophilus (strain OY26 / ATCC MYA-4695 / CBS 11777 / NBRC 106824 / NRRL Y48691) TaxID=653667 RepID=S9VXK8_SCHCR|nr:CAA Xprenyl protease [Schizosaccharomyces cryophilus OY26]EPY50730.1 CAA Xprenyl protease [Schizosaccharomyces cryophilus OY26]
MVHPFLISSCYTLLYIGSLYIFSVGRPKPGLVRNDPNVVLARCTGVVVASFLSYFLTKWLCNTNSLVFLNLKQITKYLFHVGILFLGPLYQTFFVEKMYKVPLKNLLFEIKDPVTWRNLVIGPLSEELMFRCAMVPLFEKLDYSWKEIILLAPLLFGFAHFHHSYELLLNYPGAYVIAMVQFLVQFFYTTIFGWYSTYVFLQTHSLWPTFLIHSFCNFMGLPVFYGKIGTKSQTTIYYILLITGLFLFAITWNLLYS